MNLCSRVACFFFFSSRRRHTRYWRDWSSDVCSSDLQARFLIIPRRRPTSPAISEMAEGGALESERLPGGANKAGALARLDRTDLGHWNSGRFCRDAECIGLGRRHGADDFEIVAAGERGLQQGRLG